MGTAVLYGQPCHLRRTALVRINGIDRPVHRIVCVCLFYRAGFRIVLFNSHRSPLRGFRRDYKGSIFHGNFLAGFAVNDNTVNRRIQLIIFRRGCLLHPILPKGQVPFRPGAAVFYGQLLQFLRAVRIAENRIYSAVQNVPVVYRLGGTRPRVALFNSDGPVLRLFAGNNQSPGGSGNFLTRLAVNGYFINLRVQFITIRRFYLLHPVVSEQKLFLCPGTAVLDGQFP